MGGTRLPRYARLFNGLVASGPKAPQIVLRTRADELAKLRSELLHKGMQEVQEVQKALPLRSFLHFLHFLHLLDRRRVLGLPSSGALGARRWTCCFH